MRAHIGVVTWNRLELTRLCLSSLLQQTPPGYGLTVVDNGSSDGTQEYLQALASAHPHLARLQQQARASRKGLWAQPRPLAPWSYRQRHQR